MSAVAAFEQALIARARDLDDSGGRDLALLLADYVINELRNGPVRLDPDTQPADDVEYEVRLRTPAGKRLATYIKTEHLEGLDDEGRIKEILTATAGIAGMLEAGRQPTGTAPDAGAPL